MSQTTERAFATHVEATLLTRGGFKSGSNAAVAHLQKHRTARITPAVTGKIDVRSNCSPLRGIAETPTRSA